MLSTLSQCHTRMAILRFENFTRLFQLQIFNEYRVDRRIPILRLLAYMYYIAYDQLPFGQSIRLLDSPMNRTRLMFLSSTQTSWPFIIFAVIAVLKKRLIHLKTNVFFYALSL